MGTGVVIPRRFNGPPTSGNGGPVDGETSGADKMGAPYVVVGFPLGREGRKWEGGAAIFSADGELCARARGLWVELRS